MTIIKLSDIWQWSKNNYLFFVFLPVIFLHLPNLPQWVFLAYLVAWVIALPKLQSQKLFRIFYFIFIVGCLFLYKEIIHAEFWVILLILLLPITYFSDSQERSLLLSLISFLSASIFIFTPDFIIAVFVFMWVNCFLVLYVHNRYGYRFKLLNINFKKIILFVLGICILTASLFILIPRFQLTAIAGINQPSKVGMLNYLDFDKKQNIFNAEEVIDVYKIKLDNKVNFIPYWKTGVLTLNIGNKWISKKESDNIPSMPKEDKLQYTIIENRDNINFSLPVLGDYAKLKTQLPSSTNQNGELILKKLPKNNYQKYEIESFFSSQIQRTENIKFNSAFDLVSWSREKYALVKSENEFVDYLNNYFRENFTYALENLNFDKNHPIDSFFFDFKRGYCTHYATATVIALRANNIPANIVIGYVGGEWNNFGQYYKLTSKNAHAWVEAKINGEWIKIDPTANLTASDEGTINLSNMNLDGFEVNLYQTIALYFDYINTSLTDQILDYGYTNTNKDSFNSKALLKLILTIAIPGVILLALLLLFKNFSFLFDNKYQRLEEKWRITLISQGYIIHEESSLERLNHSLKDQKTKKIAKLKEINDRLLDLRYGLAQKTTREYERIKILINEFKFLS